MDEPQEKLDIVCPYCETNVPLIRDRKPVMMLTTGSEWWMHRGVCSGCSRPFNLSSRPDGQAQRSYGKSWKEFWER